MFNACQEDIVGVVLQPNQ